jgi:hypothetical protein
MWQPDGLENAAFRLVPTEELFAGKMLAMLDRVAPRDLFDVMLLPELDGATWGSPRLRKIFIALSATLAHPLMQYGKDRLTRIDDRVVDEQLSPMIRAHHALTAAELRSKAWTVMQPLLELTDEEREYIERLHRGELQAALLFPGDPEMTEKLGSHPALRWKLRNIQRHKPA